MVLRHFARDLAFFWYNLDGHLEALDRTLAKAAGANSGHGRRLKGPLVEAVLEDGRGRVGGLLGPLVDVVFKA